MAADEYYEHTTYPAQGAAGSSASARAEFEAVETGFSKLPDITGNGNKLVVVNAGGTALEATGTPALGTPASGTLTNCTGLPAAGVSGTALVTAAIGTTVQAYDADLTTLGAGGTSARSFLGLAIGTDVQAYDAQLADVAGLTPTDNGVVIGNGATFVVESDATLKASLGLTIGTNVQAWDAQLDTWAGVTPGTGVATALAVNLGSAGAVASLGTAETFTAPQRGTVTTDNDGSFDMNVTNNFLCTPSAGFTLTFTNITAGQSGNIYLVNGSNYAVAAAATTKVTSSLLSAISATGEYWLSYWSPDGTNVLVAHAGDFA